MSISETRFQGPMWGRVAVAGLPMTPGDLDLPKRRSIRLQTWNYSAVGAYFVTVVTHQRRLLFGNIFNSTMRLSPCGEMAQEEWLASASIRKELDLDIFVVMPNHVHGIVWLVSGGSSEPEAAAPPIGGRTVGAARATGRSPLHFARPYPEVVGRIHRRF